MICFYLFVAGVVKTDTALTRFVISLAKVEPCSFLP